MIFFPISIRFQTNQARTAYSCICARLAEIHREVPPASMETPVEVWREVTELPAKTVAERTTRRPRHRRCRRMRGLVARR